MMAQNEEWLEAAYENFLEAIQDDNISLAKDIIADVQEEGFTDKGREMNLILRGATDEHAL